MPDALEKTEHAAPYRLTDRQMRYLRCKRVLDAVLSLVFLLLLAVPMAVIALLLKLCDPKKPVLFRQRRVGRNGELFTLYKFRSMRDKEHITPLGRFLRTTSLDELPQLAQVLMGTMSLIGPRPLIPQEEKMHQMRRAAGVYQLRPGLTGLAQINGRDRLNDREKAAFDLAYLEQTGFRQDWRIFRATIGKVLRREDVEDKSVTRP